MVYTRLQRSKLGSSCGDGDGEESSNSTELLEELVRPRRKRRRLSSTTSTSSSMDNSCSSDCTSSSELFSMPELKRQDSSPTVGGSKTPQGDALSPQCIPFKETSPEVCASVCTDVGRTWPEVVIPSPADEVPEIELTESNKNNEAATTGNVESETCVQVDETDNQIPSPSQQRKSGGDTSASSGSEEFEHSALYTFQDRHDDSVEVTSCMDTSTEMSPLGKTFPILPVSSQNRRLKGSKKSVSEPGTEYICPSCHKSYLLLYPFKKHVALCCPNMVPQNLPLTATEERNNISILSPEFIANLKAVKVLPAHKKRTKTCPPFQSSLNEKICSHGLRVYELPSKQNSSVASKTVDPQVYDSSICKTCDVEADRLIKFRANSKVTQIAGVGQNSDLKTYCGNSLETSALSYPNPNTDVTTRLMPSATSLNLCGKNTSYMASWKTNNTESKSSCPPVSISNDRLALGIVIDQPINVLSRDQLGSPPGEYLQQSSEANRHFELQCKGGRIIGVGQSGCMIERRDDSGAKLLHGGVQEHSCEYEIPSTPGLSVLFWQFVRQLLDDHSHENGMQKHGCGQDGTINYAMSSHKEENLSTPSFKNILSFDVPPVKFPAIYPDETPEENLAFVLVNIELEQPGGIYYNWRDEIRELMRRELCNGRWEEGFVLSHMTKLLKSKSPDFKIPPIPTRTKECKQVDSKYNQTHVNNLQKYRGKPDCLEAYEYPDIMTGQASQMDSRAGKPTACTNVLREKVASHYKSGVHQSCNNHLTESVERHDLRRCFDFATYSNRSRIINMNASHDFRMDVEHHHGPPSPIFADD